jgi:hypothetical protein
MPFKTNAAGRHHIPRQRQRVTNWSEYDAALRQRGSLTVWVTEETVAAWQAEPRTTRGGQPQWHCQLNQPRSRLGDDDGDGVVMLDVIMPPSGHTSPLARP